MNTSITITKKALVTLMLLLVAFTGNAQTKKLKSYLSSTTYCVPGMTPYVENAIAFENVVVGDNSVIRNVRYL